MVNTSNRPISVDGVRLDTLAWNIEKIERSTAARRSGDYDIQNLDGVVPSLNDPLEAARFGLQIWLRGTDADGAMPAGGSLDRLRVNLDELLHLFGKRHALLEVTEQVSATETRRALAKVTDSIAPDLNTPGSAGTFTVAMVIPSGVWEDAASQDWVSGAVTSGTAYEVTTLRGSTERVNDAVYLVTGPATNPRIVDPATGMYVELGFDLPAGQFWRFNSGTWTSRTGTGVTFTSSEATGTDRVHLTTVGGPSRAYGLPLTPVRDTGQRRISATLSGSGLAAATRLSIRARRKFSA